MSTNGGRGAGFTPGESLKSHCYTFVRINSPGINGHFHTKDKGTNPPNAIHYFIRDSDPCKTASIANLEYSVQKRPQSFVFVLFCQGLPRSKTYQRQRVVHNRGSLEFRPGDKEDIPLVLNKPYFSRANSERSLTSSMVISLAIRL